MPKLPPQIQKALASCPVVERLKQHEELCWFSYSSLSFSQYTNPAVTESDVLDASARLQRFAPCIASLFPETAGTSGIIESTLTAVPHLQETIRCQYGAEALSGRLLAKLDCDLPISGSVKARGGIYEVLTLAERIALHNNLISIDDNYIALCTAKARSLFSDWNIVVGSTGNLGLSIGIMGSALGFNVTVHMSSDAKTWKKKLLREKGVTVVEHEGDYSEAVATGRMQAMQARNTHFVDDENSKDLFVGYAVAGMRLPAQLQQLGIVVSEKNPLYVYLPCGVGGGPGGIAFGLKLAFGDAVRCFFAEPTHSPAMLLGLCTELHDAISVQDIGLDNVTAADGLAVGRPSGFVGRVMAPYIDGVFTVGDTTLYNLVASAWHDEKIKLEPSAAAGFSGCKHVYTTEYAFAPPKQSTPTHIVWCTGGNMVPEQEWLQYINAAQ